MSEVSSTERTEDTASAPVLHVLAGSNAGAEIPLATGEWLIGSGPEADLTFAEPALAAVHLRLAVDAAGLRIVALAEGLEIGGNVVPVDVESNVPLLVPLRIGATLFALGAADADWAAITVPAAASARDVEKANESVPSSAEGDAPTASAGTESAGDAPQYKPVPPSIAPSRPKWTTRLGGRRSIGLLSIAVIAILSVVGRVGWFVWFSPPPIKTPQHAEPLQNLRRTIRDLGMQDSLSVAARGRGKFAVTGQLHTDTELRKLSAEIMRTELPVEIDVATDSSMTEMAATILRAFGVDGSAAVTGTGVLTVRGFAPNAAAMTSVLARLRSEVSGVRSVEDKLLTPERAREVLEQRLQSAGLSHILRVSGNQRRVTVAGLVPLEQEKTWAGIATHFRNEYASYITLDEEVAAPSEVAPRGVILGRTAYIVLDSGRRVRVGETLENVGRVMSIDARRVRVQTSAGPVDVAYVRPPNWILEDDNNAATRRD